MDTSERNWRQNSFNKARKIFFPLRSFTSFVLSLEVSEAAVDGILPDVAMKMEESFFSSDSLENSTPALDTPPQFYTKLLRTFI